MRELFKNIAYIQGVVVGFACLLVCCAVGFVLWLLCAACFLLTAAMGALVQWNRMPFRLWRKGLGKSWNRIGSIFDSY